MHTSLYEDSPILYLYEGDTLCGAVRCQNMFFAWKGQCFSLGICELRTKGEHLDSNKNVLYI